MIVKDIVIHACKILALNDILDNLLNNEGEYSQDVSAEIEKMILSVNMTSSVIASQYIENIDCVYCNVNSGFLRYQDITDKQIVEIKNVFNSKGDSVEFDIVSEGIYVDENYVKVEFAYYPKLVDINDELHLSKVNDLTFVYGVIGEYLFLKGDFEESYVWDKKFKIALESLVRSRKNVVIPAMRWL